MGSELGQPFQDSPCSQIMREEGVRENWSGEKSGVDAQGKTKKPVRVRIRKHPDSFYIHELI